MRKMKIRMPFFTLEMKPIYRLLHHSNSLSNKMDNSLLTAEGIIHKYMVVEII